MLNGNYQKVFPGGENICEIPKLPLAPGRYSFNVYSEVNGLMADWIVQSGVLNVIEGDYFGTGRLPPKSHGGVLVKHRWRYEGGKGSEVDENLAAAVFQVNSNQRQYPF
jgi:hypothetical protein